MSIRDDFGCNFPGCSDNFDQQKGARVAALRDGDIVAFCREHREKLIAQGVNLRTLLAVQREWNILHGRNHEPLPEEDSLEELQARREQEFIASLK